MFGYFVGAIIASCISGIFAFIAITAAKKLDAIKLERDAIKAELDTIKVELSLVYIIDDLDNYANLEAGLININLELAAVNSDLADLLAKKN